MEGKLGRYRKGVRDKDVKKYGDWQKIKAKFDGRCTLCKEDYAEGSGVLWNQKRTPGNKIAHISCVLRENK